MIFFLPYIILIFIPVVPWFAQLFLWFTLCLTIIAIVGGPFLYFYKLFLKKHLKKLRYLRLALKNKFYYVFTYRLFKNVISKIYQNYKK